jgi:ABC-2 type transport system ATP-binding protein
MSISIKELTKTYGNQAAVDAISFDAHPGIITGFLGPNGAGKSTTMKMLTGYVRPTSGQALICDLNVLDEPIKVKRMIGYLPEHNPLYLDMYVREFLGFIASAHGLSNAKNKIEDVIQLVGLDREKGKRIGALSKGYRQRVGMAKALIHDPKVLILDEPTTGLDPNQILEIRQVIKTISKDKTVILSTHIMQEVESLCDQVVIIDKGKIVANDAIGNLKIGVEQGQGYLVTFEGSIDDSAFVKAGLELTNQGEHTFLIQSDDADLRAKILKVTSDNDFPLLSMSKAQDSLEDVFHQLTQKKTP